MRMMYYSVSNTGQTRKMEIRMLLPGVEDSSSVTFLARFGGIGEFGSNFGETQSSQNNITFTYK